MSTFRDANDDLIVPQLENVERIQTAEDLERLTIAVAVSFTWMGLRRALDSEQKNEVAATFNVSNSARIGASKKLLSATHPVLRELRKAKSAAKKLWQTMTMPFEDGIRLLRVEMTETFGVEMEAHRQSLLRAAANLQAAREEILQSDRDALGRLFNPADYPLDFTDQFNITVTYPVVTANPQLEIINKAAFELEKARVREQFAAAGTKIEALMVESLQQLVGGLAAGLTDYEAGSRKKLPIAAMKNLQDFLATAKSFGVSSNSDVQRLAEQAERIAAGFEDTGEMRSRDVRAALQEDLQQIQTAIAEVAVRYEAPTRQRGRRVALAVSDVDETVSENTEEAEDAGTPVPEEVG